MNFGNEDPILIIDPPCCGEAHTKLLAALEHLRFLGFEKETIQHGWCTEEVWHNRLAEQLRDVLQTARKALESGEGSAAAKQEIDAALQRTDGGSPTESPAAGTSPLFRHCPE